LLFFISSEKTVSSLGLETGSFDIPFFLTYLGVAYLFFCVFFIIAARDPLKNILWIQLAMVWSFLKELVLTRTV
jgi:ABC-type protease/lipase transport system fused ATPase/permease subunit